MENVKVLLSQQRVEILKSLEDVNKKSFDLKVQKETLTKILKQVEKSLSEFETPKV